MEGRRGESTPTGGTARTERGASPFLDERIRRIAREEIAAMTSTLPQCLDDFADALRRARENERD